MKSASTTIAACLHCRTILVCTRQVLFHPLAEERESVRTMLGNYWFHHSRTRFDGQFHRCAGVNREAGERHFDQTRLHGSSEKPHKCRLAAGRSHLAGQAVGLA